MGIKEKKRSKKASQGPKKKRDRSRSRKKCSKKPRHLEDSISELNDDSQSSASSSSYSSEEDVKRRSSRSRARKDGKGRRRRARSSSSSSNGSFESLHAKKRKKSRGKVEGKKKSGKKNRRAVSVSSASSDESDYDKSRGRSKNKEIGRRYSKDDKSKRGRKRYKSPRSSSSSSASEGERERKRDRSLRCSSVSMSSESESETKRKRYWSPSSLSGRSESGDQHVQDEMEVRNNPIRKLRSIIVVAKVQDQDTMSEEHEDDFPMRGAYDEWGTKSNIAEQDEQIKESTNRTEAVLSVADDEDLESILRRKALENLKRFKGGPKDRKSDKIEASVQEVKQLPESENVADQKNVGGSDMKIFLSSDEDQGLIIKDSCKVVDQVSTLKKEEVSATPSGNMKDASVGNFVEIEIGGSKSVQLQLSKDNKVVPEAAAKIADNSSPTLPVDTKSNSEDDSASGQITISETGKPESELLLVSQEPLAACSTMDFKLSPPECLDATPGMSKCSSDKKGSVPINEVKPKTVSDSNSIKEANTIELPTPENSSSSSLPITVSGDHASSEHQTEAKEGSQFQEKTMSVMRCGELVQVSYKVYIPKKAPAPARRRLNR